MDLFVTLLSMGKETYLRLLKERKVTPPSPFTLHPPRTRFRSHSHSSSPLVARVVMVLNTCPPIALSLPYNWVFLIFLLHMILLLLTITSLVFRIIIGDVRILKE